MENWAGPILVAVVAAVLIGYYFIKRSQNRKAAQTGEDKERVRRAAASLLQDCSNYLYAHWEKKEHYGRTTKTTYFRYVVTYQDQTLRIAPLYVDKHTRQMQIGQPYVYSPDNLGKLTYTKTEKNGNVAHMSLWLYNKQGQTVFQLDIDAENLRSDRFHPVNLLQQEECAAFDGFLDALSRRLTDENPKVDDLIKADGNKNLAICGMVLAIVGAVLGFLFPPVGAALGFIGLIICIVSAMRGLKEKKFLIISIVCLVWSAVFTVLYQMYK